MASMAVASLLAGLDATAVSTAMPSMIRDLGTSQNYTWIANAYLLTTTAFTPIFGQTANIFGRRALTIFAIVIFAVGSAIAGPAPTLGELGLGRAIQGIGCGGLNALVEMVVCDLVFLHGRGKFMGFVFAIYAISTTAGPLVGGAFATYATWRWIFYLNLPLSVLTLAVVLMSLGALPKGSNLSASSLKRVDWAGNALLVAAVTSILLALTWGGNERPWPSWRAILPLVLVYWLLFVLSVYFQAVLGASAFKPGVNILPTAAVSGMQIIAALVIGLVTPVTLPTVLTPLPEPDVAVGTATWAFMRGFGTIWGAAITLAVFNSKANWHLRRLSIGLGFALFGFLLTFLVKELPMRTELETKFGMNEKPTESKDKAEPEANNTPR
ncbi:hypothetical protein PG993_013176 [Apiospora rasikravindrae]|uniref:Major facilitator superfamily (MFS) profile domain-containing protein n=1 Tax=Apiospora rasikravindrae TaxID=990691 RepID=A0ABR1RWW8_9PEZI